MLATGLTAYLGLTALVRLADHRVRLQHALQTAELTPAASWADNPAMEHRARSQQSSGRAAA